MTTIIKVLAAAAFLVLCLKFRGDGITVYQCVECDNYTDKPGDFCQDCYAFYGDE